MNKVEKLNISAICSRALRSTALVGLLGPTIIGAYAPRARAACTGGGSPYMPASGDTVNCTGTISSAVIASQDTVHVNLNSATDNSYIAFLPSSGSTITLNGTSSITGPGSYDISLLSSDNNVITLNDSSALHTTAGGTYALSLYNSSHNSINLNDTSSIINSGSGPSKRGILINGYTGSNYNAVTLNGGSISSTGGGYGTYGILVAGHSAHNTITVENGSSITGDFAGIWINSAAQADVTLDGTSSAVTITGSNGPAIHFGDNDDNFHIAGAVTIHGNVTGGAGTDTLTLNDATLALDSTKSISGFENINLSGANIINGGGTIVGSANLITASGSLTLNGTTNISTTADNAYGIGVSSHNGNTITLNDTSSIHTTGIGSYGISLANSDATTIDLNGGSITTTGAGAEGIKIYSPGATTLTTITVENGSSINADVAIFEDINSRINLTLDGTSSAVTLNGTSGTAIQFGNFIDTVNITGDVTLHGSVHAGYSGGGADRLFITDATLTLGTGNVINQFENINLYGDNKIYGGGTISGTATIKTNAGSLELNNSTVISATDTAGVNSVTHSNNDITLNGSSSISAIGDGVHGIYLFNHSDNNTITLNSTSSITTSGNGSHGVNINNSSTYNYLTLHGSSSISAGGNGSHDIYIGSSSDHSQVSLYDSSHLHTVLSDSVYIKNSSYNSIALHNSSYIYTSGYGGRGIVVQGASSSNNDITLSDSSYILIARGGSSSGIALLGAHDGTITLNNTSHINTSKTSSFGISLVGAANNTITLNGTSAITATHAHGINFNDSDDNTIILNGGTIVSGAGNNAINLVTGSTGNSITIENGSTISGNVGIYMTNDSSAGVTLNGSTSAVSVTGTSGQAIRFGSSADHFNILGAVTINGDVHGGLGTDILNITDSTLTLTGTHTVDGFNNINLYGDNKIYGGASIVGAMNAKSNSGSLGLYNATAISVTSTAGDSGVNLYNRNNNTITLNDTSSISANSTHTYGIYGHNADSNTIVLNDHSSISANTFATDGIFLENGSDFNNIALNDYSHIYASGSNSQGIITHSSSHNHVVLNNSSYIETAGDNGKGVNFQVSTYNYLTLNNSSSISTSGSGADAIALYSASHNTVVLNNAATVSTTNNYASGVSLGFAYNNTITLNNTSHVSTAGNHAYGMALSTSANNNINLNNTSQITTSGDQSHGILLNNSTSNTITLNGGSIAASGTDSYGIKIYSPGSSTLNTITVENGSSINGTIGVGSDINSRTDITLDGTSSAVGITGTGGTAIDFSTLNDTLSLAGTVNITGNVNGNAGTDTLNIGTSTININTGKSINGFENVNITGTSHFNGDLNAAGDNITSGSGSNFHVNGFFEATSFTVGSNAEFGGNNTFTGNLIVGNAVVGNNATLAPGNSIGHISVVGNLTFTTGSIFEVEVAGSTGDTVSATGDITIQPGVTLDVTPLSAFSGSFDFLTAGGTLTGTFDTVNLNGGLVTTVVYGPTTASFGAPTLVVFNTSSINAMSIASAQSGLLFADAISDESANGALEKGKYVWGKGIYRNTNHDTSGGYNGFVNNTYGTALGGDYELSDNWKVGLSLANLENGSNVKQSPDKTNGNSTLAALYGTYTHSINKVDAFATLGVLGGYDSFSSKRTVSNSGVTSEAKADSTAYQSGTMAQVGVKAPVNKNWNIMPKLGISYINVDVNGYGEKNGGLAGINVNDYSFGTLKTSEGVSVYNKNGFTMLDDVKVLPRADVSISQEYAATGRNVDGSFSTGSPFSTRLDNSDNKFISTGFGADFIISDTLTGYLNYEHSFGSDESRDDAKLGISKKF